MNSICFVSIPSYGYFDTTTQATGGAERQLSLLAKEMTGEFEVHFIVGDYGQSETKSIDGVTLHKSYQPSQNDTIVEKFQKIRSLNYAITKVDADLYVFRGSPYRALVNFTICKSKNKKFVYNFANDGDINPLGGDNPWIIRELFKLLLKNSDKIITQTEKQKHDLMKKIDVDSDVIPNGYPESNKITPLDDRDYFLWVGRINKNQKRPHKMIQIANELPNEDFLIIGPESNSSEYQREFEKKVAESPNIEYLGYIGNHEIHDYFSKAIALVNTSKYEGFPNTFLEAWRKKTPVVSLNVPVSRFISDNEVIGSVNDDVLKMVGVLENLSNNMGFRRKQAEIAYKYFKNNYSISECSREYSNVLEQVISN
jgi:glycosyltransferase involved in cell wall biosynthesis